MNFQGGRHLQAEIKVSMQGRLVIPAPLRKELEIRAGDTLVAHLEEGRVVLEKRENIRERVRKRFADVPKDPSLADELILERREEARKEGGLQA